MEKSVFFQYRKQASTEIPHPCCSKVRNKLKIIILQCLKGRRDTFQRLDELGAISRLGVMYNSSDHGLTKEGD